jgi:hypothetical protein
VCGNFHAIPAFDFVSAHDIFVPWTGWRTGDHMYALFLEQQDGHLEWFCAAPDEERARVVARFSSKYGTSPVVVVKQSPGANISIAAFRDGRPVPLKH